MAEPRPHRRPAPGFGALLRANLRVVTIGSVAVLAAFGVWRLWVWLGA